MAMSTILTRSSSNGGKRVSLAEAGPYVLVLLARERPVLLEWDTDEGESARREGRMVPGARAGGMLEVALGARGATGRPVPGKPVTLVIPMQDTLWRFTTAVRIADDHGEGVRDASRVTLDWPTEVVQEPTRRHHRAPLMLPVTVTVVDATRGRTAFATHTLDFSVGGAQLALPTRPLPDTELRLAIRLAQETVDVGATVAWTRVIRDEPGDPMFGVGVRFTTLTPRVATRLRTLFVTRGGTPS